MRCPYARTPPRRQKPWTLASLHLCAQSEGNSTSNTLTIAHHCRPAVHVGCALTQTAHNTRTRLRDCRVTLHRAACRSSPESWQVPQTELLGPSLDIEGLHLKAASGCWRWRTFEARGLSWSEDFLNQRHLLWAKRCRLWPPALREQGEGTAVSLQALTESELQQAGFLFKTHLRTLKFEPISGKSVCSPAVAGRLPAQPSVP